MSNFNFLERERRKIFKEFFKQYLEEGYSRAEAKHLATIEAEDYIESDKDFIEEIYNAEYEDR